MKTTRIMNKIIIYLARRKSPIRGNGKRWQAPAASTGIGKVMTGTTLIGMVTLLEH